MKLTTPTTFEQTTAQGWIVKAERIDVDIWNLRLIDKTGEVRAYRNVSTKRIRIITRIKEFAKQCGEKCRDYKYIETDFL